jgi:hypothetical protein
LCSRWCGFTELGLNVYSGKGKKKFAWEAELPTWIWLPLSVHSRL